MPKPPPSLAYYKSLANKARTRVPLARKSKRAWMLYDQLADAIDNLLEERVEVRALALQVIRRADRVARLLREDSE